MNITISRRHGILLGTPAHQPCASKTTFRIKPFLITGLVLLAPFTGTIADGLAPTNNTQISSAEHSISPGSFIEQPFVYSDYFPSIIPSQITAAGIRPISTEPVIGAAHALNLALDIPESFPASSKKTLMLNGPWLTDHGLSRNTQQLIRAIQDASVHGLNPEAYELSSLLRTVDALNAPDQANSQPKEYYASPVQKDVKTLRYELAQQLSNSFVLLAEHLGSGIVDAESVQKRLYRPAPEIDTNELLETLKAGKYDVTRALATVTPQQADYHRLTDKMRDLLTEQATGIERPTVHPTDVLADGQATNDMLTIQLRLIETGELPISAELRTQWSQPIRGALRAFQKRHGIEETGIADERTRTALNMTISQEIESVALSLERWRWMPRDLGQQHIFVNIPDYRVAVRDGDETLLSMKTVIGSVQHPTPAFSRDMSYMDVNPTWTVPSRITNDTLIPLERKTPGYLVSRDFIFLKWKDGKMLEVPAAQVTREDFAKKKFPYTLRQRGGSKNALGRMKFMMPNPYAIYLHDTPLQSHFEHNDRAYSNGCIRLSEPENMARLLLDLDGYSEGEVNKALAAKRTKRVNFRDAIPTHLTYMTTWVDSDNVMHHRADIYQHNAALATALRDSNTLLTVIEPQDINIALNDS